MIDNRKPMELSFSGNVSQNWSEWYEQFSSYLIAIDKDEESDIKKINILLKLIGSQGIEVFNNFNKREITSFDTVVRAFKNYCNPKTNVIIQRYKFGTCIQKLGQSFDDYFTELKMIAATCEYEEEENMIRDQILLGVRDPETRVKLLTTFKLTLNKAKEICKAIEGIEQELQEMETSSEVHIFKVNSDADIREGKSLTKNNFILL